MRITDYLVTFVLNLVSGLEFLEISQAIERDAIKLIRSLAS
jgi:hypothetical protein